MKIRLPEEMDDALRDLGTCLAGLGPYRDRMVLAGGIVPVLYRHLDSVRQVDRVPLATFDLDIALPAKLAVRDHPSIAELLTASAFESRTKGSDDPPVVVFQHARHGREGVAPIYVEFLAPLSGPEMDRAGAQRRLVAVQHDLRAQALRYIGLLLERPLALPSARVPALRVADPGFAIRVPHPAMFLLQKMLCRDERPAAKRDKDLAYVFDVVTLFSPIWAKMGEVAREVSARNSAYSSWIARAKERLSTLFSSPTADGPVSVRRVYGGSGSPTAPSEDGVFRIVGRFLDESGLRA
jgi:hypothetical protein